MGTQESIKLSMGTEEQKYWEHLLYKSQESIKMPRGTEEQIDWEHLF